MEKKRENGEKSAPSEYRAVNSLSAKGLGNVWIFRPPEGRENIRESRTWRRERNRAQTLSVRRETGRWQQMKVLHVEEVADHNGPESCVVIRKDG
ncbi:MAG TPA: hypothetical protein VNL39_08160, partial [Xanthobacteraceae bacterium]|nr:hypothetical protein [Xanthobacteraceae bacterium]